MATTHAQLVLKACPRCGGPLYSSYQDKSGGEYSCLFCGEYVFSRQPGMCVLRWKPKAARGRAVAETLADVTDQTG